MQTTIVGSVEQVRATNALYLLGAQPKAHLLNATPEWVVAQAVMGYTGVFQAEPLTKDQQDEYWKELGATKLKGPLEMANTFWMVENVTRAFTHQLARYRLGTSMVQESQRFSIQVAEQDLSKGNLAKIMVPAKVVSTGQMETFIDTCELAMEEYHRLIAGGADIQDARSVLPTHICTRLYLSVNMAALAHIYEQRSCCQTQGSGDKGEWELVVKQMKTQLHEQGFKHYAATLIAPWENKNCVTCGFGANFDRPCRNQYLFDANLDALYWKERK